jgi:sporulation protein YlmC with PRC-barrel domain
MLHIPFSAVLVGTALIAIPAAAQTSSGTTQVIERQSPFQWRASKMIGLNVYSPNNEKIGDISEILLDDNGNAEAAVLGVGGFLGIGTKDVAVPFKSLQWKMDRARATSDSVPSTTGSSTSPQPDRVQDRPDHAVLDMTPDQLKAAPEFKYAGGSSGSSHRER